MSVSENRPTLPTLGRRTAGRAGVAVTGVFALAAVSWTWLGDKSPATLAAAAVLVGVGAALGLVIATYRAKSAQAAQEAAAPPPALVPFSEALERLPDPFLIVRGGEPDDMSDRRIVFANAAARAMPRSPKEGALLVTVFRRPEVLEVVDEAIFGRTRANVLLEDGVSQTRFWQVFAAPLDAAGTADAPESYALLLLRDETEVRRAERMRADFLANASHELRTPLASLAGYIETLRGHAKDDPAARDRFLAIMSDQAERMGRLTEDLLHLSRIELSEHVPPTGRCDLSLATADVADALQPVTAERRLKLALRLPAGGEADVLGDRDQVVQVIQNLVDNAAKYSPDGGAVRVEVGAMDGLSALPILASGGLGAAPGVNRLSLASPDRVGAPERYVFVRVTDQGAGMAREHLPRLAERFYRVEGQKSGARPGTGLGLAIVKHIVNRHRGGLIVESAPGVGSSFTAYFPAAEPRLRAVEPPAATVQAAETPSPQARSAA